MQNFIFFFDDLKVWEREFKTAFEAYERYMTLHKTVNLSQFILKFAVALARELR